MGLGGTKLAADIKQKTISRRCPRLTSQGAGLRNDKQKFNRGASPTQHLNDQHTSILRAGRVVSRSLANAVDLTKHDGNGDNRFAIIIRGSSGDYGNSFEQ